MKKITKIISIFTLAILLSSCGFKQINKKNIGSINIQNINVIGEKRIAYTLKNNILLISDISSKNKYDAEIKIQKTKNNKIKNKLGQIKRFTLSVSANLQLINLNNNNKIRKTFLRNSDYEVAKIHSNSISNENSAMKIIIEQLTEDIINFINFSVKK